MILHNIGAKDKKSSISATNNDLMFVKMIIALSSRSKLLVWSWVMQLMCKMAPKAKSLVCLHDWWQAAWKDFNGQKQTKE